MTSVNRCTSIRDNILKIDIELKTHYEDRKRLKEDILFKKSAENKNYMYRFIKRAQKSLSKIGPFLHNGKIIDKKPCDILKSQYEQVFTIPMEKYKISNPDTFFSPIYTCQDCINEFTHICPLDQDPESRIWNLYDINDIIINPNIIQSIMEKLEPSLASGLDGIPAILLKKCAKVLSNPLTMLWQLSFDKGEDPIRLKGALVFPNLKEGGKHSDPTAWLL